MWGDRVAWVPTRRELLTYSCHFSQPGTCDVAAAATAPQCTLRCFPQRGARKHRTRIPIRGRRSNSNRACWRAVTAGWLRTA